MLALKSTKISKMEQKYECRYCSKKFHKEKTLVSHVCVKKRRHMDINSSGSRYGFRVFQRFYELTANSKKPKTMDEFIDSAFYIDFVKFGNHVAMLKPLYIDQYVDFIIKHSVKLKDWTKDFVYDLYIKDLVKKEPANSAVERSIVEIMEWSEKNQVPFNNFFNEVSANEASYMIKTGKISPWLLYLSANGGDLLEKFNEDHEKIIGEIIDPGFWMKKFKKSDDDVTYIKSLLEQMNL
jgi:hypothetical protein